MLDRTYGSAMSALETTYINLCITYKSYGYLDQAIDNACKEGETFVLIKISSIPIDSEAESIKNKDFLVKMISIFTNLGYQFEVKDENFILISWLDPYSNIKYKMMEENI